MNRLLLVIISICFVCTCATPSFAQIKTKRHYDFIDNETNSANLRKVGIVTLDAFKNKIWQYGCIDEEGNEVVNVIYDEIEYNESCNLIKVKTKDYKYGLLTADGKYIVAAPKYASIWLEPSAFNKHRCFIVRNRGYDGIVNDNGQEIVSSIYEDLNWLDGDRGYLRAKLNSHYGIIDITTGKFVVEPNCKVLVNWHNGDTIIAHIKNQVVMLNLTNGKVIDIISNKATCLYYNKYSCITDDLMSDHYIIYSVLNKTPKTIPGIKRSEMNINSYVGLWIFYGDSWSKHVRHKYVDDLGRVYKYSEENKAKRANEKIEQQIETELEKRRKIAPEPQNLAAVNWLNSVASTSQAKHQIELGIKSDSKIENVEIMVNDNAERGINIVESGDYDMRIAQDVTLREGANRILVSVTNAAGTVQDEKTIIYSPAGDGLPAIKWIEVANASDKREIAVTIGINSKTKIEDVTFTVNGTLTRGINTVESSDYDMAIRQTLTLSDGVNRIVASARNAEGITTSEKVITYNGIKPTPIINDRRVALVIGNAKYKFNALSNPGNDARCVAEKLKELGFEVMMKLDADLAEMDSLINSFGDVARECDVALFYYAGHGVQSNGVNYLLPVSVDNTLRESELKYKTTDVDFVLSTLEASQCKLKMVILDACRNNPLPRSWNRGSGLRGLSILEAPTGTIISFATSPGKTAKDDTEANTRNSPYANAFLKALDTPNLDVFHFFQQVGSDVQHSTKGEQIPWLSTSFTGEFYFNQQ